ncbi:hypothetical protein ACFQER_05705 [Halomicroarcula sp. GCM10025894]|uniref:hypothetical protein n=1 Tax=Halomicroarcula sp. GCM10025894 TaxID=3252673 RepID=UPI00361A8222
MTAEGADAVVGGLDALDVWHHRTRPPPGLDHEDGVGIELRPLDELDRPVVRVPVYPRPVGVLGQQRCEHLLVRVVFRVLESRVGEHRAAGTRLFERQRRLAGHVRTEIQRVPAPFVGIGFVALGDGYLVGWLVDTRQVRGELAVGRRSRLRGFLSPVGRRSWVRGRLGPVTRRPGGLVGGVVQTASGQRRYRDAGQSEGVASGSCHTGR